jgi:hypothetical protein
VGTFLPQAECKRAKAFWIEASSFTGEGTSKLTAGGEELSTKAKEPALDLSTSSAEQSNDDSQTVA